MLGTGLPVSMYTTKTPIDKCHFNDVCSYDLLKWHLSIGVFVVYIDTGSPVTNIPSKSHGLADENKKFLTEWK
jgi:hypothetical protein